MKKKRSWIGNFYLVGYLYDYDMVDSECINKYLDLLHSNIYIKHTVASDGWGESNNEETQEEKERKEAYIECLCALLKNIRGKCGNWKVWKDRMNTAAQDNDNFSNRERFMFMDVRDL